MKRKTLSHCEKLFHTKTFFHLRSVYFFLSFSFFFWQSFKIVVSRVSLHSSGDRHLFNESLTFTCPLEKTTMLLRIIISHTHTLHPYYICIYTTYIYINILYIYIYTFCAGRQCDDRLPLYVFQRVCYTGFFFS